MLINKLLPESAKTASKLARVAMVFNLESGKIFVHCFKELLRPWVSRTPHGRECPLSEVFIEYGLCLAVLPFLLVRHGGQQSISHSTMMEEGEEISLPAKGINARIVVEKFPRI
jgi:hypothetical protein